MVVGTLAPSQFTIGASASDASDRFIYNDLNGDLFFDVDGTGGAAQIQLANLGGAPELLASDIVVF